MSGPRLALNDVACARGGRLLFERLSLALEPGGAALVSGANGAGKSSLLRLAAGLLPLAGGRIEREGEVAIADEALALDPRLALGAALGFWARIDGGDAGAAMAAMGIGHLAPVPVRMLSTGQRKRATLARVIASGVAIWLLDEPANGLDGDGLALAEAAIATHRAEGGIALVATHQSIALPGAGAIAL